MAPLMQPRYKIPSHWVDPLAGHLHFGPEPAWLMLRDHA